SVLGAVSHNMIQLWVAYLMLVKNESILLLAPIMIIAAIGTGIINGFAGKILIKRMKLLAPKF
ncbi:MAG: Gx transporter family protein, partial [Desulfomonilaceae bacterium]